MNVLVAERLHGLPQTGAEHGSGAALLYFSFSTLTTAGFGDITPRSSDCAQPRQPGSGDRHSYFPATLLARLVTLEIEHRKKREKRLTRRSALRLLRLRATAERGADVLHLARPLIGARGEQFAQPLRGVRIAFEDFQERRARNAQDRGSLARRGGGRPLRFRQQRRFAEQGAGPGNDFVFAGRSGFRLNEPCWTM